MKRKRNQQLIVATATAAGLAIGASIALAAHPPVQLYTFEEVAAQHGMQKMPVFVDPVTKQGFPYSPKQTCGSDTANCHDYNKISKHAFHSAQGMNQYTDSHDGKFKEELVKPFSQSGAMMGKW